MYICILNNYTNLYRFISFKYLKMVLGMDLVKKIFVGSILSKRPNPT